nr:hypothetical protein [Tanacetum cinerariifolium]
HLLSYALGVENHYMVSLLVDGVRASSVKSICEMEFVRYELSTTITKLKEQMTSLTSLCEMTCQIVQKKLEEKQIEEEQAAKAQNRKLPVCYDDDDDEEESNSLKDNNIFELPPCSAVTPNEPVNSLSMGDEHLDTISATESDELIKSSVEDLVPIPSESEGENGCDVKDKQEKDKIGTKPDKNGKRGKARQCRRVSRPNFLASFLLFFPAKSLKSTSFPQQYPCCEDCGVLPEADHCQPPQYTVNHPIFNAHNGLLGSRTMLMEQMEQLTSMCELFCQFVQKKREEKHIKEEQAAKAQNWKLPVCYDDDDDEERSNSLHDNIISGLPSCSATTPNEHYSGNGIRRIHKVLSDYESDSSDYQSCSDEDFLEEIFTNPLFEEKIIPMKIDQHHFNVESDLIESMLNHDSSIIPSSLKIDSLLDEFTGELTLLKSISPGIKETDCYSEEDIRLIERLLYDNSSPRPLEEFISENSNAESESFSPSPIPNKDSDSRIEEIDLTFTSDDPMPSGIEDDDDDSERDVLILEELFNNYSLSLPVIESYHFDIPSFSHPLAKPPDGNTRILNIKMMGDNSEQKSPMPRLMITRVSNKEKSPDLLSHRSLKIFQLSAKCLMMIHGKNIPILDVPLFHFYPLDQFKYGGNWVKLSDLKQALRGRHPMLIRS